MYRLQFIVCVILGICLVSVRSWAETAYVTDSFKVTFRSGPGLENRIINMLSSGQPLEVLDSSGEWTHVRLLGNAEDSKEGWILSQYIMTRQPWKMQALSSIEENTQIKEKLTPLENKLSDSLRYQGELETKLKDNSQALSRLKKEYESLKQGSAGYLELKATYTATQAKLETVEKEFTGLTQEYKKLSSSERNRWFATGAGVLLLGLIIGLVLGRLQRKRRSSYY
jgi:SH3 domain protein